MAAALFPALAAALLVVRSNRLSPTHIRVHPHHPAPTNGLGRPRNVALSMSLAHNGTAGLTMGDVLLGSIQRSIEELPDSEHVARAERTLDALLSSTSSELDAIQANLDRQLHAHAQNTSLALGASLREVEELHLRTLNQTADTLEAMLAPTRSSVQAELQRHVEEQAAASRARERRRANQAGFRRASTWRHHVTAAATAAPPAGKHPVVMLCEASSLALSLMLLLLVGDVASSRHAIMPRPHIVSAPLRLPSRADVIEREPPPSPSEDMGFREALADMKLADALREDAAGAEATTPAPTPAPTPRPATATAALLGLWWPTMRGLLAVWFFSFGTILLRSGSDEWAARALGIEPCDNDIGGGGYIVRYEYDWERGVWQEEDYGI